jgi:hypothetical protein
MLVEDFYRKNNLEKWEDLKYCKEGKESNFMCGDIESSLDDNSIWKFELIVVSDGYRFYTFYDLTECIEWMFDVEEHFTIYFHNLDFDMLFFFVNDTFRNEIKNMDIISSGNLTIAFTVRNITFKNSLTLFPMPLKGLVKKFLHVNDLDWLNDKSNVLELDKETLLNYCFKDVIYLMNALIKFETYFQENFQIGLTLTVPSMALKVWTKQFNPDKNFLELNRRSSFFDDNYYFGGHTEKFTDDKMVFRNVNYYDVNSLYPSEMIKAEFINSKYKRTHPTVKNLKKLIRSEQLFFTEIVLNVDSEYLRMFPVLDEINKVNLYPFGKIKVKVSEVGIKFILRWGSWSNILEVNDILVGSENVVIKPFEKFVDVFYKLRKSDSGNDVIFKLLLNSLYGKFGQKLERDVKVMNSTRDDMAKANVNFEGLLISTYTEQAKFYSKKTNRLDVAGKITEMARLTMGGYMNLIREEFGSDSVIYTDTDSIITYANLKGSSLDYLLDESKLGLMSDEIGYTDNMICLGQKMYHFYKSGKKATKGVKSMDLDMFRGVLRGSNTFENQRFSKFNSLITRGFHGIQTVPYMLKNIRGRLDV